LVSSAVLANNIETRCQFNISMNISHLLFRAVFPKGKIKWTYCGNKRSWTSFLTTQPRDLFSITNRELYYRSKRLQIYNAFSLSSKTI